MERDGSGVSALVGLDEFVVTAQLWRKVRVAVLAWDNWECQIRGPGCRLVADQVDHIVSWREGGLAFDPANLRAACGHCNAARGGRLGAAKSSARFSERRPSQVW